MAHRHSVCLTLSRMPLIHLICRLDPGSRACRRVAFHNYLRESRLQTRWAPPSGPDNHSASGNVFATASGHGPSMRALRAAVAEAVVRGVSAEQQAEDAVTSALVDTDTMHHNSVDRQTPVRDDSEANMPAGKETSLEYLHFILNHWYMDDAALKCIMAAHPRYRGRSWRLLLQRRVAIMHVLFSLAMPAVLIAAYYLAFPGSKSCQPDRVGPPCLQMAEFQKSSETP